MDIKDIEKRLADIEARLAAIEKKFEGPAAAAAPVIPGFDAKYKGIKFAGSGLQISTAMNAYNYYHRSYVVTENGESTKYIHFDGSAKSIIEQLGKAAKLDVKPSWNSAKIADEILKMVLGSDYEIPIRGKRQTICYHALVNGYLLEFVYENDGCGYPDSIKKNAHIYRKG